ncbi:lytic transglycosylase, partial [Achromobacter aegrifaciens]
MGGRPGPPPPPGRPPPPAAPPPARKIPLTAEDDQTKPDAAVLAVKKLI